MMAHADAISAGAQPLNLMATSSSSSTSLGGGEGGGGAVVLSSDEDGVDELSPPLDELFAPPALLEPLDPAEAFELPEDEPELDVGSS